MSDSALPPADQLRFPESITFDDVLLMPQCSDVLPDEVNVETRLTRRIKLNIPLVSAAMDTVTESALAIAIAQEGGFGVIHKNLSIEEQCREVRKVKRSESGVILDPVTLSPDHPVATAQEVMKQHNISGVPIVQDDGHLVGIITRRDLKFVESADLQIRAVMTSENLVTGPPGTTLEDAERILTSAKVEKLLLVNNGGRLAGLITMRDVERNREFDRSCKDERGRLRVGAAVGVHDYERVEALLAHDVDVIVVDTAHGHSTNAIETVKTLRSRHDVDIIAGNIAGGEAAKSLIEAGADAVKVGVGPGSICTTRVISGCGVPQLTAIMDVCRVAASSDVVVIADGGIRRSGDITKAVAAGAHCVMIGSLFAGVDESPGEAITWQGRRFKTYRGMGSMAALLRGSGDRYGQKILASRAKLVPEGVEAMVPWRGPLADYLFQLVGGLRAGMSYCGARTVDDLRQNAKFCRVTAAGVTESHPHDVTITKESPNYEIDYPTDL
ncbi:MAG: IMP dehydrogenase [Phycisphaerae bacterium]|nr:IMP dehydrogenase [Phycisphaerae bacterium]